MSNWKLGKIQHSFLETTTSGGTLTLTSSSKMYQIFTGSFSHTMKLPDATTMKAGLSFAVINISSGSILVQDNGSNTVATVAANGTAEFFLTDISSANGIWRTFSGGSSGTNGIGGVTPGSTKTSNYTIVSGDDGSVINVDSTSGAINITLPSPSSGFKITVKDLVGKSSQNPIYVLRSSSSIQIDSEVNNDIINKDFGSVSYISDGSNWFRVSGFDQSGFGRGLFGGGYNGGPLNTIDYITIATQSNAVDFGDLTQARNDVRACASSIRGVFIGGQVSGTNQNTIDFVTIASTANAYDFGDLSSIRRFVASCSSNTRGVIAGGAGPVNTVEYITIATQGNAVSWGANLNSARDGAGSCASQTRGLFAGGSSLSSVEYVTIATTGAVTSFSNLLASTTRTEGCSNATRGLFANSTLQIDYVTIATLADHSNFGNLTVSRNEFAACSSQIRGVFGGDNSPGNTIDFVNFATIANATSFGTLSVTRGNLAGCSNAHGGL